MHDHNGMLCAAAMQGKNDLSEGEHCWLCSRPFETLIQWHHPVPKAKKGRGTVPVHPICHKAIHANFTNSELARIGDNPEAIRAHPAVAKFVAWVGGKPPDFHAPTRR